MAGLTGTEITLIAIILVIAVVLALAGSSILQRLRRRRDQLRGELAGGVEVSSDRAYNRIAMARRELGVLLRQGADVSRASEILGEAQAAFDLRQFDRAYEQAQSAHEMLVTARQRPLPPSPAAEGPIPSSDTSERTAVGGPSSAAEVSATKIPPHRAEAQFQMRLLSDEVALAKAERPSDGRTLSGNALLAQAQTAYDRGQYAEAFRLALKGRREVGGSVETVPLTPPAPDGTEGPAGAPNLEAAAEAVAAADRCPSCGHPMLPDEPFCRGCGVPRSAPGGSGPETSGPGST